MVNLSLSKEELDVVYYALKNWSASRRLNVETIHKCDLIDDSKVSNLIASQLKESAIADKLCNDCINLMLDMLKH